MAPDTVGQDVSALAEGQLAALVIELLERAAAHCPGRGLLDELGEAAATVGLTARREPALIGGGTVELLVSDPRGPGEAGVAVVLAGHGATDALRARLRGLGAHREIAEVVVATTRRRHLDLPDHVRRLPVHVLVLDPAVARSGDAQAALLRERMSLGSRVRASAAS